MKQPKVCKECGQVIPQPEGRLICSQCGLPIVRGSGGWTHGGDGRPRHKDCNLTGCVKPVSQTLDLLGVSDGQ